MRSERINIILSKNDIEKIRRVYNNENISEDYLNFEVANIMKCEAISKEKVINKIVSLVNG